MSGPESFARTFYDLATSISFCAHTARMGGDPNTKTGREVYVLEHLLRSCVWKRVSEQPLNLIDLGTGSGQKTLRIVDSLISDGSGSMYTFGNPVARAQPLSPSILIDPKALGVLDT